MSALRNAGHWKDVRTTSKDVGKKLQAALRGIESANPKQLDGIFGDAQWTNKERLPDVTLKNLLEHFSQQTLSLTRVPEDELGNGYEFLIKKFADDSGHTAQEFYTNRTVVQLMVQMLDPRPGERIYDPTCGTGGMLISALAEVKRQGGEHRTLKLFGQERNHMTASIARMNLVLHGVEGSEIARGDTLASPVFAENDQLQTFDVVLANPPYSIKQWNRDAWTSDPWGRNFLGTPPQGRADYAFFQHLLKSMDPKTGRSAVLFPHGVLFRKEEAELRRKLIEADLIECVLGLGPNLFYNSPMEACVVFCRSKKQKKARRQGPPDRRHQRGHPRAGHQLPHPHAPGPHRAGLQGLRRRAWLLQGGYQRRLQHAKLEPLHPALREAPLSEHIARRRCRAHACGGLGDLGDLGTHVLGTNGHRGRHAGRVDWVGGAGRWLISSRGGSG
jgi:type I restriction enzyme M protein